MFGGHVWPSLPSSPLPLNITRPSPLRALRPLTPAWWDQGDVISSPGSPNQGAGAGTRPERRGRDVKWSKVR